MPPTRSTNSRYPPWFTRDLIKRLNERNKYRIKFKKYGNPLDLISYRTLSERCEKLAKMCYDDYVDETESRISKNSNYFWSYVKHKRGGTGTYPPTFSDGIIIYSNGNDICNLFASHFSSVCNSEDNNDHDHKYSSNDYLLSLVKRNCDTFSSLTINDNHILHNLKSLDISKGAGSDCIPPLF